MEEFFSQQTYYEFPSIEAAIFALLLSFTLSTVIAITYRFTYRGVEYSKDYFQAIVLISIIAATIMMAIGDSLARGLGILGALAIVRFRYRFDNPKNIIYVFAALAIGIATGVYGFAIAVAGTLIFSLVAFVLYFSVFGKAPVMETSVAFNLKTGEKIDEVEKCMANCCNAIKLMTITGGANALKYEYQVSLIGKYDNQYLFDQLSQLSIIENIRVNNRGSIDRV